MQQPATQPTHAPQNFSLFIDHLKETDQDFEFYPTTERMINVIRKDLINEGHSHGNEDKVYASVLDIGAGDGRVLKALTEGERYAIEKSESLLSSIKHDTFILGTDFHQQTLIDKKVSAIFTNPPYSEYESWVVKTIKEANAPIAYLIIPQRWENSDEIKYALQLRDARTEILYTGDFLEADRKARAKVHVVKVMFYYEGHGYQYGRRNSPKTDPFDVWFNSNFKIQARESKITDWSATMSKKSAIKEEMQSAKNHELIRHEGIVKVLERLYQRDLDKLMQNYKKIEELDPDLLYELGVNIEGIREALKLKIKGLKDLYWQELFNRLDAITNRLTLKSRERMLSTLTENTSIDFNADNAHGVVIWVVKNANVYFDQQLIDTFERMNEHANIKLYKSNEKTFGQEEWRYGARPEIDRYKLDYRIVLSRVGGIHIDFMDRPNGISGRAADFLNDLHTIAGNVCFDTHGLPRADSSGMHWSSGVKNEFHYRDTKTGELRVLFEAKCFKNGNTHIKMNQAFMCALNCEFGRLKGWLKTREQAAEELDIPLSETTSFGGNMQLTGNDIPRLLSNAA